MLSNATAVQYIALSFYCGRLKLLQREGLQVCSSNNSTAYRQIDSHFIPLLPMSQKVFLKEILNSSSYLGFQGCLHHQCLLRLLGGRGTLLWLMLSTLVSILKCISLGGAPSCQILSHCILFPLIVFSTPRCYAGSRIGQRISGSAWI